MSLRWTRRGVLKLLASAGLAIAGSVTGVLPELGSILPGTAKTGKPGDIPPGVDTWWDDLGFGTAPTIHEGADLDRVVGLVVARPDINDIASRSGHKDILSETWHAATYKSTSSVTLTIAAAGKGDHAIVYYELSQVHNHFKSAVHLWEIDGSTKIGKAVEIAINGKRATPESRQTGGIVNAQALYCGACTWQDGFSTTGVYACGLDWNCLMAYCVYGGGPCWIACLGGVGPCLACMAIWCAYWYNYGCVNQWCETCTTCAAGTPM